MARRYELGRQARTRALIWRYCLTIGAFVLFAALLEVSLFARWKPFGAVPDLMIATVFAFSFFCGCYAGAITGIAAGVLIDALGSVGISILPVVYLLVGYVSGYYAKLLSASRYGNYLFYLLFVVLVRAAVTVLYASLNFAEIHLPEILLHAVLPEAAGTFLFGALLFFPVWALARWMERGQRK